jgi:signal transduction histidine kinase/ligand-binding sensor domain-containing protein
VRALTVAVWAATLLVAAPRAQGLGADKPLDRLAVERWRVSDGLPGDSVQALAQAADGQLWIATLGGLARWDGIRFTRVQGPADGRFVATDVRRLLAAWDGSVWAGSPYFPPLRFAADQPADIDPAAWGRRSGVLAWSEDEAGTLWMLEGHELLRFADRRLTAQPAAGLEGRPTEMHLHSGGTLWVGTDQGLFSLVAGRLVRFAPLVGAVSAMHEDRRGVLWVAAGDRLWALDGSRTRSLGPADGLPRGPIDALADDEAGNLWLGAPTGLGRVRGDRVELFTTKDGLPEDDVTAVLIDREGSLWVGTRNGGLAQFSGRTLDTRGTPPELDGVEVLTVCEDAEGAWWYGTQKRGAVRVLRGRVDHVTRAEGLPSDHVLALLPGDGGEVWIGTTEGLRTWRKGVVVDPGIWKSATPALYRDRHGGLWIAGNSELGHLEAGKLTIFTAADGLPGRQVRAIAEDGAGTLWVSGLGGPVVRWENGRFVRPASLRGFRTSPVRSMLTDRSGAFWLSVDRSGLLRVGRDGVRLFDGRQGLEAEILYQLLEDDDGDLWLGTNKSVLRLSRAGIDAVREGRRATLEVVSFETTDRRAGVVASALRQPSAWKGRDGRLRFATQRGVVEIDPRQIRTNDVRPPVVIEQVIADGRAQPTSGEAHLPPRPGRLEIHYAARALLEPSKVRYRYRLEGLDPGWVEAGPGRLAVYAGLPSGAFRFRVQASNNDRLWNEDGATLQLVVASPLYRRPWFYGACALGLVPIAFGLYRVRMARLHAHYVGMFTERTRMARELHDTLLQGMSGIAMQLRAIRSRLDSAPEGPRRDLERLEDTVTRCLEEARRAVWDLRDQGRRDSALGPALARFARRLFRPVRTGYDLKIEGPPRHLPNAVEDELFRIAQEALRNAVAHAQATLVRIRVCYDVDTVTLTVSDDGVGFDSSTSHPEKSGHFGLAGLHERADKIGARLEIRSAPGTGTTVEVVAPAPGGRA